MSPFVKTQQPSKRWHYPPERRTVSLLLFSDAQEVSSCCDEGWFLVPSSELRQGDRTVVSRQDNGAVED